ncbi:hypothetical protein EYC84_000303 [Monilinia fructicola]|uniref:Uncharacterized protein n=1 Tax=Monilinia fructicola TaxID=38448 RepID=A0A5M9JSZ8_MONFR|nr:hypothetical protein EYC84_000303 [Monilinia fructicola]
MILRLRDVSLPGVGLRSRSLGPSKLFYVRELKVSSARGGEFQDPPVLRNKYNFFTQALPFTANSLSINKQAFTSTSEAEHEPEGSLATSNSIACSISYMHYGADKAARVRWQHHQA